MARGESTGRRRSLLLGILLGGAGMAVVLGVLSVWVLGHTLRGILGAAWALLAMLWH
jgi:hypothetical protein